MLYCTQLRCDKHTSDNTRRYISLHIGLWPNLCQENHVVWVLSWIALRFPLISPLFLFKASHSLLTILVPLTKKSPDIFLFGYIMGGYSFFSYHLDLINCNTWQYLEPGSVRPLMLFLRKLLNGHVGQGTWCAFGGQRTTLGSYFYPSTMWGPGIKLRPSVFKINNFTVWAVLLDRLLSLIFTSSYPISGLLFSVLSSEFVLYCLR